jgi:flagellar biosynthesis chaperone FliJ
MNNLTKPVWDVLISKSDVSLRQAQSKLDNVLARKKKAEVRQNKLDDLLLEYGERLNKILARIHNPDEAAHYRQFIIQLQHLGKRAREEYEKIDQEFYATQKEVITADQERAKLVKLGDRAKQKIYNQNLAFETKKAEAQSMMQFNLNSRSKH